MEIIDIKDLKKNFKVLNRHEGLKGTIKDLFSRDYKYVNAVDGITMQVKEGEIVGYLGPNGAGKSTTIKMMTGVLEPTSGSIFVNGNIPHKNRVKNAQNIGVVFGQRSQLWWSLPVIESFKILKEIYRIDDKVYKENLEMFDELVNISSLYSKPVRQMSLGQKTLCDIVAAFLHNPKIIFLDEPTIGLDVYTKDKVRTLIKKLNDKKKTTVLLTTHDIGDIEALCQRVIIIDNGKIIFDNSFEKLRRIFGSYRTLKINSNQNGNLEINEFCNIMLKEFYLVKSLSIKNDDRGWIDITMNQDEVALFDVLNYAMKNIEVKDVAIEEVKTENVIKKIYEGGII